MIWYKKNHFENGADYNNNMRSGFLDLILKGHSQLWDRAGLDTAFASLKSVYLNPKSNLRVGYI